MNTGPSRTFFVTGSGVRSFRRRRRAAAFPRTSVRFPGELAGGAGGRMPSPSGPVRDAGTKTDVRCPARRRDKRKRLIITTKDRTGWIPPEPAQLSKRGLLKLLQCTIRCFAIFQRVLSLTAAAVAVVFCCRIPRQKEPKTRASRSSLLSPRAGLRGGPGESPAPAVCPARPSSDSTMLHAGQVPISPNETRTRARVSEEFDSA